MLDRTMPDASLEMRMMLQDEPRSFLPPAPYGLRTFREGEERTWCEIVATAGEFDDVEEAMKRGFAPHFKPDSALLPGRIFYVVDENDVPVASATAWFSGQTGQLHWVAVHADHQGMGLARPAISASLRALWRMGYKKAMLYTQPQSWVAIRLYQEFGFRPVWPKDEKTLNGWKAVYEKLGKEFTQKECADPE